MNHRQYKKGYPSHGCLFIIVFLTIVAAEPVSAFSADAVITIQTEIKGGPVAGIKSTQTIEVFRLFNRGRRECSVRSRYRTGTTLGLPSVRNRFTATKNCYKNGPYGYDGVTINVKGQTASGVRVMPNINYRFTITLETDRTIKVNGCHDGYPSYNIKIGSRRIYYHHQEHVGTLFGSCDTHVSTGWIDW